MSKALRAALLLLAAVLLAIACNTAAFFIDTPALRENAAQAAAMLGEQQAVPELVGGFKSAQLDNYTSVLIVKTAAYVGHEPLAQKALGGFRRDVPAAEGQSEWDAYACYEDGDTVPISGLNYSRYWHGYTLPLRLLLCVLNLSNIQMLLLFAQLALLMAVALLMARRSLSALIPGFFTAWFLMMPAALGLCLQYAPVSLLTLAACAALLAWPERIGRFTGLPAFFALIGMATSYFDLLTFPLVSLGYPLVLLLALRLDARTDSRRLWLEAVACCAAWGMGWAGMWALKWLLNAAVFGAAYVWESIFGQTLLRLSLDADGTAISRLDALRVNANVLLGKRSYQLLIAAAALSSLLAGLHGAHRHGRIALRREVLVLLLPLAAGVLWFLVLANHTYQHYYFAYRTLTVSFFALYALLTLLPAARTAPAAAQPVPKEDAP